MAKPKRNQKSIDREREEEQVSEAEVKKDNFSEIFIDELKGAFTKFDKIPETKRIEKYGNEKYLEQFWEYFKAEYPNLLDKISKKDLPVYLQAIKDKWFTIGNIKKNSDRLHREFESGDLEMNVINKSLSDLKEFCEDPINKMPDSVRNNFADSVGCDKTDCTIKSTGRLRTVDDLRKYRKEYAETEMIVPIWWNPKFPIRLKEYHMEAIQKILNPNYNPTERIMINIAINKIRKVLSGSLKAAFDAQFPQQVDAFSNYQDLNSFAEDRVQFIKDHAAQIDESLAKELDDVIVTNGDIQDELLKSWRKFDDTRGFSEWEQYFRSIFNKLVTRQLFDEVHATNETIDHYMDAIGKTFKQFPPYVNTLLDIYPFNDKQIAQVDALFRDDYTNLENEILALEKQIVSAPDKERKELRTKVRELKQQQKHRQWQAYIAFLNTKEPSLAGIFHTLVENKFNFSRLTPEQQQTLINTLVKNKLEDTIKNKVPELLSTTDEEITKFMTDLFDLNKMEITIPTRHGDVPITFAEKKFMATSFNQLPWIENLEDIKNLPLNFVAQLTEGNADFFEKSPVFSSLYTEFAAKNWTFKVNDSYEVRIRKDGKLVKGYLSAYSPIDKRNLEQKYDGTELYLYTKPITSPSDEREIVTMDGTSDGVPVVIKSDEQQDCEMEVLDRKLNINGEAFWALLFSYVLGQESMNTEMSSQKEDELAKKLGKLDVYKEKAEEEEEPEPLMEGGPEAATETTEDEKFIKSRENLPGYGFPEEQYKDHPRGFVEGSTLFCKLGSSEVPPPHAGDARFQMKITKINKSKWTFTVKTLWGEVKLWKYEGKEKELPINESSIKLLKDLFGESLYKLPDPKGKDFNSQLQFMIYTNISDGIEKAFKSVKFDGSDFTITLWDEAGEKVEYFWRYDPKIGEKSDEEAGKRSLYKVKHNPNHTFTLTAEFTDDKGKPQHYIKDMDYPTFMLFIKEKDLQPKSAKQAENIKKQQDLQQRETPTTARPFSIGNIIGFFKNSITKVKDGIKKFDEERTEDLTDLLTSQGKLYSNIGKRLPFARMKAGFETLGAEYYLERDNRIWKKVEKRLKFYEDQHFPTIYELYLKPLLKGGAKPEPHYKMAALLLAMIKKGPGPYKSNPDLVGKGTWINILLGPEHQARYLTMRDKKIRELEQNSGTYPEVWTDQTRNELVELEMKYIVHVVDGRQLWLSAPPPNGDGWETERYFCSKYSRKFAGELDGAYNEYFKQESVEWSYNKIPKTTNFEFARFEFFRLLNDRPQKAIPYLKVMAEKAITAEQRKTFEYAVLVGMLSGIFLNMVFSDTSGFIQKVCRTRGFLPGLRTRDYNQQSKVAKLLEIFSRDKGNPQGTFSYQKSNFSFWNMTWTSTLLSSGKGKSGFEEWFDKNGSKLSEFLQMTGKSMSDKTLVEMAADPETPASDKALLHEIIQRSLEKDEEIDSTVKYNPWSLTTSVFTKSHSVVQELMKCKDGVFEGKDKDENQSMQNFRKEVASKLPQKKENKENVEYYLKKFLNWFEERGFTSNNRSVFLRRLQTAKGIMSDVNRQQEAKDIIRYSVVGTVVKSLHGAAPQELKTWLEAFKNFFENNLDQILDPGMVSDVFGVQYVEDSKKPYKLGNWIEYIDTLPQNAGIVGGAEGKQKAAIRRKYANPEYINRDLYWLAADLFKNAGETNRFDTYYAIQRKNSEAQNKPKSKATGAKIKNAEKTVDKIRRILENKPLEDEEDLTGYDYPIGDDGI